MVAEGSQVELKNASGDEAATRQAIDWLTEQGVSITQNDEALDNQIYTSVIDYTGNPFTVKYLVEVLKINPNRIYQRYDPIHPIDVEVILGKDWLNNNPLGDS